MKNKSNMVMSSIGVILIVLKVTGVFDAPWVWVLFPFYAQAGLMSLSYAIQTIKAKKNAKK